MLYEVITNPPTIVPAENGTWNARNAQSKTQINKPFPKKARNNGLSKRTFHTDISSLTVTHSLTIFIELIAIKIIVKYGSG